VETAIAPVEKARFDEKGSAIVEQATDFSVALPDDYRLAVELIDVAKEFQAEVKKVWDPVCEAANKAHKAATAGRKDQIEPFLRAEKILKDKCNAFDLEQERLKREAEEKLRRDREEADRKAREEADRKLDEAAKLEAAGDIEAAATAMAEAERAEAPKAIPVPTYESATPGGVRYQDNWKAVITSPGDVPREYCIPDQRALDRLAKDRKGENPPAGVKFINNRTIIRRR